MEHGALFRTGLPSLRKERRLRPWSPAAVPSDSGFLFRSHDLPPPPLLSPAPPSVAADGIFIAVDTDLGFSPQRHLPTQWTLETSQHITPRATFHTLLKGSLCGPTCAHLPRPPGPRRVPLGVGCPCYLSTGLPVQGPGAWGLAAPLGCPE